MKIQVKEGLYWFSQTDYLDGRAVKLKYNPAPGRRGWWCTPLEDGQPSGIDYPLSPDIWKLLKTEMEMQALTGKILS
ncbi:hypothetical protein KKG66_10780 [bacterium]|nr:hypothetical protein [bacterium]